MTATAALAPRIAALQPSATLAMLARVRALQAAGTPILDLTAGEPDFAAPPAAAEAGVAAIRDGRGRYTPSAGMADLLGMGIPQNEELSDGERKQMQQMRASFGQ